MSDLRKYLRRDNTPVTAVQLDLEIEHFTYSKWGGIQTASAGDWLVNNAGDVYTVARESFERTYRNVSPGVYEKSAPVWARRAGTAGAMPTREGETRYEAGDMLVFNDADEKDGYAISAETFEKLYRPAD